MHPLHQLSHLKKKDARNDNRNKITVTVILNNFGLDSTLYLVNN